MTKEFVLWGREDGTPEWAEQLITATTDRAHLEKARAWARAHGFVALRVSEYRGEAPDFRNVFNVA